MKQPSVYLKMRVLGAIDTVQGKTRHQRVQNVAALTRGRCAFVLLTAHTPGFEGGRLGRELSEGLRVDGVESGSLDLTAESGNRLPAGSFAEKDGTFINHAGLAQTIACAICGIVSMTRRPRPVRSVGTSRQPSRLWPSTRMMRSICATA